MSELSPPLTKIVAAVVDTNLTTFYREDGTSIILYQGDKRLRPILEDITPKLMTDGYAYVDFNTENSFHEFEKTSKGFKFFRIAKEKLSKLWNGWADEPENGIIGKIPGPKPKVEPAGPEHTQVAKAVSAVAAIMEHGGVPASDPKFMEGNVAEQRPVVESNGRTPSDRRANDKEDAHHAAATDTIVAVTPQGRIVPNVERIKSQFQAAAEKQNPKGTEKFLMRAARIMERRNHTIDDLLRFMERGDLPIADDGSIIIFKRLYRSKDGRYVDPHTRKVSQAIGSYVFMRESLVDPNRRNECSNGLHVGRRGYMGSFSGDVLVLAKVRVEDVIAVPDYDANKMRVCGYHIIFELTQAQFNAVCNNRPISDAEGGGELLARAIAGDHCGVLEHVEITEEQGGGLIITPKAGKVIEKNLPEAQAKALTSKKRKAAKRKAKASKKSKKAVARPVAAKREIVPVTTLEAAITAPDAPVGVKDVLALAEGKQADLSVPEKPQVTQADVVRALVAKALEGDRAAAAEALKFKKAAKKGWSVWGLPDTTSNSMKKIIETGSI